MQYEISILQLQGKKNVLAVLQMFFLFPSKHFLMEVIL